LPQQTGTFWKSSDKSWRTKQLGQEKILDFYNNVLKTLKHCLHLSHQVKSMSGSWKNQLYFGDNLDVLQQLYASYPQGLIDLIYIDPPFNSKRNYNVLFESVDMKDSTAQKEAFADTWSNVSYVMTLSQMADLDINLYNFIKNLDNTNISKSAIAYLTTMAVRLWYMHKLLKPTGSFYLHCDPTMSHYLKVICDLIFGETNFKSEITWERTSAHSDNVTYANTSDVILFFTKSKKFTFNPVFTPYSQEYIKKYYKHHDKEKGLFLDRDLTAAGLSGGGYEYDWKGMTKIWRCPKTTMEKYEAEGRLFYTSKGTPRLKQYLNEMPGVPVSNVWYDIPPINSQAAERLGYPTQKPEALLERIITASSNDGDIVADFFCGCGTAVTVAERLKRNWVGVDISHLAVKLIAKRLGDTYGDDILKTFEIHGFPKDIDSAKELANNVTGGRLEFEEWIIEVLLHGVINERRNQMGFDGYRTFSIYDKKYVVMIEVKSGNATPSQVNHFIMTVNDKKGAIGLFICFADQITHNMQLIAKKEGQFVDDFGNTYCDRIQVISVEELMEGKRPMIPLSKVETFKKAEKITMVEDTQAKLEL